ncbi:MAG: hypothetical protein ACKOT0_08150 [bacterium]
MTRRLVAAPASGAPDVSASAHQVNWRAVPLSTPYPGYDNTALDVDCIGATCWVLGLVGTELAGRPYLTTLQGHTPASVPMIEADGYIARGLS